MWNSVRAWIGTEIGVERPVLLHDDHDMPDLVDPDRGSHGEVRQRRLRGRVAWIAWKQHSQLSKLAPPELRPDGKIRLRSERRPSQRYPAALTMLLDDHRLTSTARNHLAGQSHALICIRVIRGGGEGHLGRYGLCRLVAPDTRGSHIPSAVCQHSSGGANDRVGPGNTGRHRRDGGELALPAYLLPQLDTLMARARRGKEPRDLDRLPHQRRVGSYGNRQGCGLGAGGGDPMSRPQAGVSALGLKDDDHGGHR